MANKRTQVAKVLECIFCKEKYSKIDVRRGKYFPSTGICIYCYKKGQAKPASEWCFGKLPVFKGNKMLAAGYNPDAPECQNECPDRCLCKIFVKL